MRNYFRRKREQNRIIEIDFIRGIAIIFMIFDHLMYDFMFLIPSLFPSFPKDNTLLEHIHAFSLSYWNSSIRIYFRYFILFIFLSLVGICASFSLNNLLRGYKLAFVSLVLTLVTYIISIIISSLDFVITFGILHCISLSLIMIGILEKFFHNKWIYLLLGLTMIIIGVYFEINQIFISYYEENIFLLIFKQMIGIARCGSDCFSLLLYGGQVFIGFFLGKSLYSQKVSKFPKINNSKNIITFIGKNSLVVYLSHQIVLSIILITLLLFLGYQLII
ncbi:MAG: heparan-alpha-glucosaminide N-acetyltransferase domain-containing protein [Bacilli bacterium]